MSKIIKISNDSVNRKIIKVIKNYNKKIKSLLFKYLTFGGTKEI